MQLPFLTSDLPPVGGTIKSRREDFIVEEIPAYDACGEGSHTFFLIEKTGLTTLQAARDIARALGVPPYEIGLAGLKDSRAVARQWFSVEHVPEEAVMELKLPRIRVIETRLHFNKLRIGHLAGNRFQLRVRDYEPGRESVAAEALARLEKIGVPNYFGPQRFGARGDNWLIAAAVMRRDWWGALQQYLGKPGPADTGHFREARRAFDAGDYRRAFDAWPYMYREERRALRLLGTGHPPRKAWQALPPRLTRLFLSAFQSRLFNIAVADRLERLGTVLPGDLLAKHDTGAVFHVPESPEAAAAEQPRADRFEVSPTGPIFGYRMTRPGGEPGKAEDAILDREGLRIEDFKTVEGNKLKGARRPMRFKPYQASVKARRDKDGAFLEFQFVLTKGCYATSLLREILKNPAAEDAEGESDSDAEPTTPGGPDGGPDHGPDHGHDEHDGGGSEE